MLKIIALCLLCFIVSKASGQAQTDSLTINISTLKTLTDEQYSALLYGDDITGMDKAAVLNKFPLPGMALKYQKEIALTQAQVKTLTAIEKEFHRKKLEMGQIIIRNERVLDSIFKYNRLDNGSLIFYTNRYGLYQGELRNVILQVCLATRHLLTPKQVNRIYALQKRN